MLARYDELNLIYDLATVISSQTLTQVEVVQRVLDETNRILRAEAGAIYIHDDDNGELNPVHHFGREGNEDFWLGRTRELAPQYALCLRRHAIIRKWPGDLCAIAAQRRAIGRTGVDA